MSQYGANVMAADGSDYAQILAHYYPGTVLVV
jgi:SpoIID/LytB domain protein